MRSSTDYSADWLSPVAALGGLGPDKWGNCNGENGVFFLSHEILL